MNGTSASGVEFSRGGRTLQAFAGSEVILSAGAFNSPQILMLSGIGPSGHLRSVGISPLVDLPVGQNLHDHVAALIMYSRPNAGPFRDAMRLDRMSVAMLRAWFAGTGPATVVPGGLHAFIKTRPELAAPDIEFMFRGAPPHAHLWLPPFKSAYTDGFGIRPTLLCPESRGEVLLRSADPSGKAANPVQPAGRSSSDIGRLRRRLPARARSRRRGCARSVSRRRDFSRRQGPERH